MEDFLGFFWVFMILVFCVAMMIAAPFMFLIIAVVIVLMLIGSNQ